MADDRPAPFKKGDRIELLDMPNDPDPIPRGTHGTVQDCVWLMGFEIWQVLVDWDIDRSLAVTIPPDVVRLVRAG